MLRLKWLIISCVAGVAPMLHPVLRVNLLKFNDVADVAPYTRYY
jgi:hypothetical protein